MGLSRECDRVNLSPKVLAIGGATLDTIIQYEEMETLIYQRRGNEQAYLLLEEGKKIEVTQHQAFSGGGATNAAVALKKLGLETRLFCKIGQDPAGEFILKELKNYGLNLNDVKLTQEIGTATSFVVPSLRGDRTLFAYRGANAALLSEELPEKTIAEVDFLYITSLSKNSAVHLPEIVKIATEQGTRVAINPGSSQLKRGAGFLKTALFGVELLILNDEEAQVLMSSLLVESEEESHGHSGAHQAHAEILTQKASLNFSLKDFFKKALAEGPKVVVVTYGSKGVYVCKESDIFFHPALKVEVVNTLGAGDAFGSSFAGAYFSGMPIEDAIRMGVINSASVVTHIDAKTGLLSKEQMAEQLKKLDPALLQKI